MQYEKRDEGITVNGKILHDSSDDCGDDKDRNRNNKSVPCGSVDVGLQSFIIDNLAVDEESEKAEESIKTDVICEDSENAEHSKES